MTSFRLVSFMLILIPTLIFARGGVTSGVSFLVDEGDSEAGFSTEITKLGDIGKHFSIGGRFGFNRWTEEGTLFSEDIKLAVNILEFAPAVRVNAPINENLTYFFEPSAGFNLMIASIKWGSDTESDSEGAFGLSFATGLDIKRFEIKPAFKMNIDDGYTSKIISLAAGLAF